MDPSIPIPSFTIRQGFAEELRLPVAGVLLEAFERKMLPVLGKNRDRAAGVLAACVCSTAVLVAADGARVLGVAALKYGHEDFWQPRLEPFVAAYGWLMGRIRRQLLNILIESPCPQDQVLLEMLAVSAQARGLGIGGRLMQAVFDLARREGFSQVWLDVVDTNPNAQRLYERTGFRAMGTKSYPLVGPWMGFKSTTLMMYPLG